MKHDIWTYWGLAVVIAMFIVICTDDIALRITYTALPIAAGIIALIGCIITVIIFHRRDHEKE